MVVFYNRCNPKALMVAVVSFIACVVNVSVAADYYVDQNSLGGGSSDSNPGTLTQPWRTIAKANAEVQPGDTVYIREGTYDETIKPVNNGTHSNGYITYTNYRNEVAIIDCKEYVALERTQAAVDLSDKEYIVIDGLALRNTDRFIRVRGTGYRHCIVKNCSMKYADSGIHLTNGSQYNKIVDNYIELQTDAEMAAGLEVDGIWIAGQDPDRPTSHNLIEGNEITMCGHKNMEIRYHSPYNVIRGNVFRRTGDGFFNNTDGIADHVVIEGNRIIAEVLTPDSIGSGISRNGNSHTIIRNNVIYWTSGPFAHGIGFNQPYGKEPLVAGKHARVYNNTIANNGYKYGIRVQYAKEDLSLMFEDFVVKNNIIQQCAQYAIYENGYGSKPYDVVFSNNLIRGTSDNQKAVFVQGYGDKTLLEAESTWPAYFKGNIQGPVMFQDAAGHDYRLRGDSPCIDAGAYLTRTTSSGSGNQMKVEDAYCFYDGFGIVDGDLIQLEGQTQTARIESVDYDNNVITVDRTLSWSAGQGVSLPYHGSAPDIGAYEYTSTSTTYALSLTANHGSITKTPDKSAYDAGETVTIQAVADTGYEFAGWSGDLSGSTNPTTVTMNANKSITADFTEVAPTTYTLSASAAHGSITKTPDKSAYDAGETVTVQAVADTGYEFAGWSGDLSGSTNPATVTMNANKSITAGFTEVAPATYTLSATATHGSVTKTPAKASYDQGETVTLTATPDTGYSFSSWSGDASGTSPSTTVLMDRNKSVTANFTANTYTLAVGGTNGSVTRTPDKTSYTHGETVTLTATPNTGYSFASWSGDASGTNPSATVTMDSNKSATANFTPNTYTLTVGGTNGSVTRTPDKTNYTHGETVTVAAVPSSGYDFVSWSGDLTGETSPATLVMDTDKSVTATFRAESTDKTPPVVMASSPEADAFQVPLNSLLTLHVSDDGEGVDANTVTISIDGTNVYSGNVASHDSADGVCRRTGTKADYLYAYQSETEFDCGDTITVRVNATDLNGNEMSEYVYSFATEMWAFGANRNVSWGPTDVDKGHPVTVSDASDNIWVVWHAGAVGQRDICVSRRSPEDNDFAAPIRLTTDAGDQIHPDIAIDADNTLYVVWQDNRRGNWDIYLRTSVDGINWSAETRITDSDDSQTAPAIAVDSVSGCHVAWEDDGEGHQNIYVASSSDGFVSKTVARVTSDASDQTDPDIAVDASGNVYLAWTDDRNGSDDIYGAASNSGPWTNVALVTGAGNQYAAALATEDEGAWLHLVWADDAAGNSDVYYASTNGMPSGPLAGFNVIDDTLGADQLTPTLATTGSTGNGLKVFVCWQDWRNVTVAREDTDLYFVEVRETEQTNVLVGDDGTNSSQDEPGIGIDSYGHPYVVWTDGRYPTTDIYYAGTTHTEPVVLDSELVVASTGGTVGVPPEAISSVDDVSVLIPPRACPFDVTVTISCIINAPASVNDPAGSYEFGPSGLTFEQPVTVTIPYATHNRRKIKPYYYDSVTGTLSDKGITDIVDIFIKRDLRALQFKTTHFTSYYLVSVSDMEEGDAGSSGSGGGCSLSYGSDTSGPVGYFIPYILIAGIVLALRFKDAKQRT